MEANYNIVLVLPYINMNPPQMYTDNADFLVVEQASPNAIINMYVPKGSLSSSTLPESESLSVVSDSLQPHGLYSPWNSLGQNTGVGCLSLLQEIFPTQGSNPGLLHCRQILYQLSYQGVFPKSASDLTQGHFKLLSLS